MRKVTSSNYRKDKFYPSVVRCVSEILETGDVVTPVDMLIRMKRLTKKEYEDWRFGRIPYLERVCRGNLSVLSRILRILDHHARARGLKPSQTVYKKWGRGGKRIVLRFTKYGDKHLEAAYSRHYVAAKRLARRKAAADTNATTDSGAPTGSSAANIVPEKPTADGKPLPRSSDKNGDRRPQESD